MLLPQPQRFAGSLIRGIDLGSIRNEVDGGLLPLFHPTVVNGFVITNETRVSVRIDDHQRLESRSEEVKNGRGAFLNYKLFAGGHQQSSAFKHEASRLLGQSSLSAKVEVCSGQRQGRLDDHLVPECRQDIEALVGMGRNCAEEAMNFLAKWGTHYVTSFKAGGKMDVWRHSSFESEQGETQAMEKAHLALKGLFGIDKGSIESIKAQWMEVSKEAHFEMEGGDHAALVINGADGVASSQRWIASVTAANAVVLESNLGMVSDFFAHSPVTQTIVKWAIDRRCHMAMVQSIGNAYHVLLLQGQARLHSILTGPTVQALRGSMSCGNSPYCDATPNAHLLNPLIQNDAELSAMSADPPSSDEMMQCITSENGLGTKRLARLVELGQASLNTVCSTTINENSGARYRRPSPCCHIAPGQSRRNSVIGLLQNFVPSIAAKAKPLKALIVQRPSWWNAEFDGKTNICVIGPTNCGKGSLARVITNSNQPRVEVVESVEEIRHYPVNATTILHDSPGCGTERYPLDLSYLVQSGAMHMTRVAVLISATQGRATIVLDLLQALRRYNIPHCLVLTQGDMVWHPDQTEEESLGLIVSQWREHLPETSIFVTSVRPTFRNSRWNELASFVHWVLHGQARG